MWGGVYLYNWYNDIGVNIEHENIHSIEKRKITFADKFQQEHIDFLKENYFISETDFSKDFYIKEYNKQIQKEQDELHLILLPAGYACNFDCVYCYENHNDNSRFKGKHSDIVFDLIKQKNPKKLHIEYFGGEPLLGLSWILDFEERIKDIKHTSSMTTNGYLLSKDNFEKLINHNVRSFQITIDGVQETHDKLRTKCGSYEGTYSTIMQNLKDISASKDDCRIIVRCNFNEISSSKENMNLFFESLDFIKNDIRFRLLFRPIGMYSDANGTTTQRNIDAYCKDSDSIKFLWENIAQDKGFLLAESNLFCRIGGSICYASKKNCYTINPNLDVLKCTIAVDQELNKFGTVKNELVLDKEKIYNWEEQMAFDDHCKNCFFFFQCMGRNCPLKNYHQKRKVCPIKHKYENIFVTQILKDKNNKIKLLKKE